MEEKELIRLRMDDEKEALLVKYINERRYKRVLTVIILGILLVMLTFAMIHAISQMEKGIYSYVVHRRHHRRTHYYISDVVLWAVEGLLFLVAFLRGWGNYFGKNSDIDCIRNMKYGYGTMVLNEKEPDLKKHPYYVTDRQGNRYICPVFLDYRNAQFGEEMYCVVLDNGRRYAFSKNDTEWWERD